MKLLLVDDSKSLRDMIKTILGSASNEFYDCSDGKYAAGAYDSFRPDIVLMDIKMENVDGFTAAKEILKNDPSAKILFVTNYAEPEYIVEAGRIGALKLIPKEELTFLPGILKGIVEPNFGSTK